MMKPAQQLEHPYSAVELDEICAVLRKLRVVQRVLLAGESDVYQVGLDG